MKFFASIGTITFATCVSIFAYPGGAAKPILPLPNGAARKDRKLKSRKLAKKVVKPRREQAQKTGAKQKSETDKLTLVEKFLATPNDTTGKALVLGKHYVTSGEGDIRIDVKQLKSGDYAIFFQQDITSEAWGFVTVQADKSLRLFKGDRCLWGVQPGSPLAEESLQLEESKSNENVLTLREVDGGSGGYEESLRLFIPGTAGEWVAAGSVPLSHAWRSPNFSDLAGAEIPYEHREVEIEFAGHSIKVIGSEQIVRRLPDQPKSIEIERVKSKITEVYGIKGGKIEKLSRDTKVTTRHKDRIPRRQAN